MQKLHKRKFSKNILGDGREWMIELHERLK